LTEIEQKLLQIKSSIL